MRLSDHLPKAFWSLADKALFPLYGLVRIAQISALGQSEFGVFSVFDAFFQITFMLVDGFALQAVVRFGSDEKRRGETLTAALLLQTGFLVVVGLVVALAAPALGTLFSEPRIGRALRYFPVLVFLTIPRTFAQRLMQLNVRMQRFFWIDVAFFGSLTAATFLLRGEHLLQTADALVFVNIVGALCAGVVGIGVALPHLRFSRLPSRARWREILRFGIPQLGAGGTLAAQQWLDGIVLQYFTNATSVGLYSTAKNFFKLFDAIRDAAGTLLYPVSVRLKNQKRREELRTVVEKAIAFMLVVVVPIVVMFELGGSRILFHLFYGTANDGGIALLNVLAIAGLFVPLGVNYAIYLGLGEARSLLRISLTASTASVVANCLFIPLFGATGAAIGVIVTTATLGLASARAVRVETGFSWRAALTRGVPDGIKFLRAQWEALAKR